MKLRYDLTNGIIVTAETLYGLRYKWERTIKLKKRNERK